MQAWERYKATEDFANNRRWALNEEHVDGSLWAAFYTGFFAAAVNAAHEITELREALEWYQDKVKDCRKITGEGEAARNALDKDGGAIACAALARKAGQ